MKIRGNMFINIRKIVGYLETLVAEKIPQIHAVTVCNTSSFLHVVGKLKFLKSVSMERKSSGF